MATFFLCAANFPVLSFFYFFFCSRSRVKGESIGGYVCLLFCRNATMGISDLDDPVGAMALTPVTYRRRFVCFLEINPKYSSHPMQRSSSSETLILYDVLIIDQWLNFGPLPVNFPFVVCQNVNSAKLYRKPLPFNAFHTNSLIQLLTFELGKRTAVGSNNVCRVMRHNRLCSLGPFAKQTARSSAPRNRCDIRIR